MKDFCNDNALSVILVTIILLILILAILELSHTIDIPDLAFLILGIAAWFVPQYFHSIQNSTNKKQVKESKHSHKAFLGWLYVIGACILLLIIFFIDRKFFFTFLLCQLPIFIFFVYADIKSRTMKQNDNIQS